MDKFLLTLIVTFSTVTSADEEPQIQIFEIRKAREDRNLRGDEFRIDFNYYDPDGYDTDRHGFKASVKNRHVDTVTDNLINKLREIVKFKHPYSNPIDDDDYIHKYKNLKHDNIIEDNAKMPVVLAVHKDFLYHIIPQHQRSMQSVLRSIDGEDIEDRTAPPPTRVLYDYEYDD